MSFTRREEGRGRLRMLDRVMKEQGPDRLRIRRAAMNWGFVSILVGCGMRVCNLRACRRHSRLQSGTWRMP